MSLSQQLDLRLEQEPSHTFEELMQTSWLIADSKGWHEDKPDQPKKTLVEELMLVVTEVCEAVEEYRNHRAPDEVYYGPDGKPEGIPIELADVFIRLFDTCVEHGVPIEAAILEKMEFNRTRKHRHGGRRV